MTARPNPGSANLVVGGGISGAVLTVVLWILDEFGGIKIPSDVASSIAVIVVTAGAWIGQKLRL